jgi:uncharacterized delta-60 repeat protein
MCTTAVRVKVGTAASLPTLVALRSRRIRHIRPEAIANRSVWFTVYFNWRRRMKRPLRVVGLTIAVVVAMMFGAPPAFAAGELDPTFSSDGKVFTDVFGQFYDTLLDTAVQPDGKIVAVGSWGGDYCGFAAVHCNFVLVRYNPNGSVDSSFGANGRVLTDFDGDDDVARAVAIQPDGRIVVAGSAAIGIREPDFALARYRIDGSLDPSFSGDGKLTTPLSGTETVSDVLIQPNGSIVAVGYTDTYGDEDFAVARYYPTGTLDPSFAGDGIQTTGLGHDERADAAALQADGKIIVVGTRWEDDDSCFACKDRDLALARYNPNGTLDASFDGDGKMTDGLGGDEGLEAVTVMRDGRFVVAGNSSGDFYAARYRPNGTLDSSFALKGRKWVHIGRQASADAVAVGSDGKIVLAGSASGDLAVARITPSGANDLTFSGDGMARTDFGGTEYGEAMILQRDGILVAGYRSRPDDDHDFVLARYLP